VLAIGSRLVAPATSSSTDGASARLACTPQVSRLRGRSFATFPPIDSDLALALELADSADRLALSRFRAVDLRIDTKPDLTPVTETDHAVEESLRAQLARARPGDAVVGEEQGTTGDGDRRWIVDPIDGTKGYARGIPVWATLIALERDGALDVGVVSAPALGARWWGTRNGGAFRDGTAIEVSAVGGLEDAHLCVDRAWQFEPAARRDAVEALSRRCWRTRGFGDFWPYVLVADGSVDVAIEPSGLRLWDLAAPMAVVEAAGGRFTDLEGVARADGGNALATNGLLHDEVLAALNP
jgi:histidinol-phosphatase